MTIDDKISDRGHLDQSRISRYYGSKGNVFPNRSGLLLLIPLTVVHLKKRKKERNIERK